MREGEAEGDSEGDWRRTLANGWESRLWRLEDKHFREGSSVRQFGRPRPLRIRHRRRRISLSILNHLQCRPGLPLFSLCEIAPHLIDHLQIHIQSYLEIDHHHHQVPDLEQTLAAMPLQTSLSSDNFKKFKPLLCPPVAELQTLSRNVILCLPLLRLPSTFQVKVEIDMLLY